MILKALCDYYGRKGLTQFGKESKEIGFLIVIDKDGNFIRLEDRRRDAKSAQSFIVKKHEDRSSNTAPNFLYDSCSYVLGISKDGATPKDRKHFDAFKDKVTSIYELAPDNTDLKALKQFYERDIEDIQNAVKGDGLWNDVAKNLTKGYSTFSFLIEGDTQIVAEKDELIGLDMPQAQTECRLCLISGEKDVIVKTTSASMIPGSQAKAKLVSFQTDSGYDSYGHQQGDNAPIGEKAEFKYTTALNHLLRTDSRNKFSIGNRTYLFWAANDSDACSQAEDAAWEFFAPANRNNPDRGISHVRDVFNSIYSGDLKTTQDDKFCILGLAPNSARIAVVYWNELPLRDFARRITRHFDDMEIIDTRKDPKPYMGLHSILSAITLGGKSSDVAPNYPDALIKSIFNGLPYPQPIFSSCIRRIKAECTDNPIGVTRAAILKAYLNRSNNNEKSIDKMLDKENTNPGYLCGRLFAVLDKIQEDANNQHSIRERYLNSASTTPVTVFSTILNLSSHHSENLSEASRIYYEKIKQEIISKLPADGFPSQLTLQDQGRFFVGYYQQRQDFFTPKQS